MQWRTAAKTRNNHCFIHTHQVAGEGSGHVCRWCTYQLSPRHADCPWSLCSVGAGIVDVTQVVMVVWHPVLLLLHWHCLDDCNGGCRPRALGCRPAWGYLGISTPPCAWRVDQQGTAVLIISLKGSLQGSKLRGLQACGQRSAVCRSQQSTLSCQLVDMPPIHQC
jgi:hypothetical protein